MRRVAILFLIACLPTAGLAQSANDDPPVAGRPVEFSNLVGTWAMRVEVNKTEVHVEEPITLRVFLTGEGPAKYEPNRKHLQLFPESFETDFYVQELRDEHRIEREAKTWLFVYRLKPKHEKVKEIDGITLWYYNPKSPGKRKYVPIFAPSIPLIVKPKRDSTFDLEIKDLDLPASYYAIPTETDVLRREEPFTITGTDIALALGLPPIACGLFFLAWRRLFPSDAERAIQKRRSAAARAASALRDGSDDPHQITIHYLRERFDFAIADPAPLEVADFLRRRGFAPASCASAEQFIVEGDAGRFAGTLSPDRQRLTLLAMQLIHTLEADRCVPS